MSAVVYGPYVATQLYKDIWSIDQDFVRSYLVIGSTRALLVDTCDAQDDLSGLVKRLTHLPITVIQTHCDCDHIGASSQFDAVYMHPSEFELLTATASNPFAPRSIREGEHIDLGDRRFEVILIPGHTPGSIALLDAKARILFSGDSVKEDIVYMFGRGRNLRAYIDSLERLYALRQRYDIILPSHGETPITSDYIPDLLEGAKRLLNGDLSGAEDGSGLPCKLYTYRRAKFYF